MTVGKAVLLTVALVAVFIVGVITGPTLHDRWSKATEPTATVSAPAAEPVTPAPAKTNARKPRSRPSSPKADDVVAAPSLSPCGSPTCGIASRKY
jgi:hypothetical protein